MASWYGKGVFGSSCLGVGPLREPRGRRVCGAAGGSGPAPRENREGKRTKALPEVGGRQGREDRERAGRYARYAIYRFISPGYTQGKQRTAIEGL